MRNDRRDRRIRFYVLNALRHQRLGHLMTQRAKDFRDKCSTPYGIRGWGICRSTCRSLKRSVLNALRHQRLGHQHGFNGLRFTHMVLNALRHQRLGHTSDSVMYLLSSSAQRLTASEVGAFRSERRQSRAAAGAQRLTASEVGASDLHLAQSITNNVLNALRHQRLGDRKCVGEGMSLI